MFRSSTIDGETSEVTDKENNPMVAQLVEVIENQ